MTWFDELKVELVRFQMDRGCDYYYGKGRPQDYRKARKWLERAAKSDNSWAWGAIEHLVAIYAYGQGVDADLTKAMEWAEKGHARKNGSGMIKLGEYYEGKEDLAKAIECYEKAADLGDLRTIDKILKYYDGTQDGPQCYAKLCRWYGAAVAREEKYDSSYYKAPYLITLGKLYLENPAGPDYRGAHECFEKVVNDWNSINIAETTRTEARVLLGIVYEEGWRDHRKAFGCFMKAAEKESAAGMALLGRAYENGLGVEPDHEKARELYEKAVALKNLDAFGVRKLDELFKMVTDKGTVTNRELEELFKGEVFKMVKATVTVTSREPDETAQRNQAEKPFAVRTHGAASQTEQNSGQQSITIAKAPVDALEDMVGLSEIKQQINSLATSLLYDRVREKLLGQTHEPSFNNFVFAGPPGVGKTTVARRLGSIFFATGIVPSEKCTVVSAHDLIGTHVGQTEKEITTLVEKGRGGVIVVDEADALVPEQPTSYHETAINTLNAAIGQERDQNTGTVFVVTGYPTGIDKLFRQNAGLTRRFPNRIDFPSYGDEALKEIFIRVVERRGYTAEPEVAAEAMKQILAAKNILGEKFGNAATVEQLVHHMEAQRAQRIGTTALARLLDNDAAPSDELKAELSRLTLQDVPVFQGQAGTFKQRPQLSLVPATFNPGDPK